MMKKMIMIMMLNTVDASNQRNFIYMCIIKSRRKKKKFINTHTSENIYEPNALISFGIHKSRFSFCHLLSAHSLPFVCLYTLVLLLLISLCITYTYLILSYNLEWKFLKRKEALPSHSVTSTKPKMLLEKSLYYEPFHSYIPT